MSAPVPFIGLHRVLGDPSLPAPGADFFKELVTRFRRVVGQWKHLQSKGSTGTKKIWKKKVFGIMIRKSNNVIRYYPQENIHQLLQFIDKMNQIIQGPIDEYWDFVFPWDDVRSIEYGWLPEGTTRDKGVHLAGHYFPFYNLEEKLNLAYYQIYTKNQWQTIKDQPRIHCLVYALHQAGLEQSRIRDLTSIIRDCKFPLSLLNKFPDRYGFKVHLSYYLEETDVNSTKTQLYGKLGPTYYLGMFKDHYFINKFPSEELKQQMVQFVTPNNRSRAKPLACIKGMWNAGLFLPYDCEDDFGARVSTDDVLIATLDDTTPISVKPKQILSSFEDFMWRTHMMLPDEYMDDYNRLLTDYEDHELPRATRDSHDKTFVFFDIESDTQTYNVHVPLCICYKVVVFDSDNEIKKESAIFTAFSVEDFFCDKNISDYSILIAHWAKYDLGCLMTSPCLHIISNPLEKGNMLYKYKLLFKGRVKKHVEIRNAYALIPAKLSQFGDMFDLKVSKSFCPFELLTEENFNNSDNMDVTDYFDDLPETKQTEFKSALDEMKMDLTDFSIHDYTIHYCQLDVQVLYDGYFKFREQIKEVSQSINDGYGDIIDINNFLSLSSVAMHFYNINDAYTDVLKIGGVFRMYLQKGVYGGACRSNKNMKHHTKDHLYDFDAVSLYPSAMTRLKADNLGYPKGRPKFFKNHSEVTGFDGLLPFVVDPMYYVVYVRITHANCIELPVLPAPYQTLDGSNPISYACPPQPGFYFLDKLSLEDAYRYQQIEFTIINGVYFPQGYNDKLSDLTEHLFNARLDAKRKKNPIEKVYKLLMNSAYGKNGEQEHPTMVKFFYDEKKFYDFLYRHSDHISMAQSYPRHNNQKRIYYVKYFSAHREHFSLPHCASIILSMSKRIMWEVIHVDISMEHNIFYQDTDSMQIVKSAVPLLENAFRSKYNRELIGNHLGQFHNDFNGGDYSKETWICGKKAYCCLLDTGVVHCRLKGIPSGCLCLKYYTGEKMNEDDYTSVVSIFQRLYAGETIQFDLSQFCKFKHQNTYVTNNPNFIREISFP